MNDGRIPFVLHGRRNGGVAERDQAERLDAVGEAQSLLDDADAFGDGMHAGPNRAESERVNGEQEVFGRGGGVLDPVFARLAGERLSSTPQITSATGAVAVIFALGRLSPSFSSRARSRMTTNDHGWEFFAEGAAIAAFRSRSTISSETGLSWNARMLVRVIIS